MARYKAMDVARWFIYHNDLTEDDELISNMKLQKLLYYAQGVSLAYTGETLFAENILAWEHGPVINEVYHTFRNHHSFGIPYENDYDDVISKEDEELLIDVYDVYGKYSASWLRNRTHHESPWMSTGKMEVISIDKLRAFFTSPEFIESFEDDLDALRADQAYAERLADNDEGRDIGELWKELDL